MTHLRTIAAKETRRLLVNPGTYIAAALFLSLMGFVFQGLLENYNLGPRETSPAVVFFSLFWLPVLFMVPMLTMRCIAEERRSGTLETLLTTPVTPAEVVLGKYAACLALYLGLWALTAGFHFLLHRFARDSRLFDPGPLFGGYLFILCSGFLFVALGVLASAWSRSQPAAGLGACAMLFMAIFGAHIASNAGIADTGFLAPLGPFVESSNVFNHLEDFTRGIIDTRQIVFHLSGTVVALALAILGVEVRLLHG